MQPIQKKVYKKLFFILIILVALPNKTNAWFNYHFLNNSTIIATCTAIATLGFIGVWRWYKKHPTQKNPPKKQDVFSQNFFKEIANITKNFFKDFANLIKADQEQAEKTKLQKFLKNFTQKGHLTIQKVNRDSKLEEEYTQQKQKILKEIPQQTANLKTKWAALTIQTLMRGAEERQKFKNLKTATSTIQAAFRGKQTRTIEDFNSTTNPLFMEFDERTQTDKVGVMIEGDGKIHVNLTAAKDNTITVNLNEGVKLQAFPAYNTTPKTEDHFFNICQLNNTNFHNKTVGYGFVAMKQKFLNQFFPQNKKTDNKDCGRIQGMFRYRPKSNIKNKKPALFFVVHGTFANESEHYRNPDTELFKDMLKFAKEWADKQGTPVDVISYHWDGWNQGSSRFNAGKFLAKLIDGFAPWYSHVGAIGHSHGTNVINVATNFCKRSIDLLIYCASPVRENTDKKFYKPKNFKTLLNFFSLHDLVQYMGAFTKKDLYTAPVQFIKNFGSWITNYNQNKTEKIIPDGRTYDPQKGKTIVNIIVKKDNVRPGHSSLPGAIMSDMLEIYQRIMNMQDTLFQYPKNVITKIKKFIEKNRVHLEINIVPKEKNHDKTKNKVLINVPKISMKEHKILTSSFNETLFKDRKKHKEIYREDMSQQEWALYTNAMLLANIHS